MSQASQSPTMRPSGLALVRSGSAALFLLLIAARGEAQVRHVLLLQSLDRGSVTYDSITSNLLVDVDARAGYPVLEAAARSLCLEIGAQRGITIDFVPDRVPAELPGDVTVTLFRILQEALANAVRHAGASRHTVTLRSRGGGLELEVSDNGRGFDAGAHGGGLGLVSMQERIKLVGGRVDISSRLGSGTTVRARVPMRVAHA